MRARLRDSRHEACAGAGAGDQLMDSILGPSRVALDPIEQWENEGGQVSASQVSRWRDWCRERPGLAVNRASSQGPFPARTAVAGAQSFILGDLHACGRCHGPIGPGGSTLLGKLLSYCIPIEQYRCMDAGCGWRGLRMSSGLPGRILLGRSLLDRRIR